MFKHIVIRKGKYYFVNLLSFFPVEFVYILDSG